MFIFMLKSHLSKNRVTTGLANFSVRVSCCGQKKNGVWQSKVIKFSRKNIGN